MDDVVARHAAVERTCVLNRPHNVSPCEGCPNLLGRIVRKGGDDGVVRRRRRVHSNGTRTNHCSHRPHGYHCKVTLPS